LVAVLALSCLAGQADAFIYWGNTGSGAQGSGAIGRANLDGTGANQSFITGATFPAGVAVDAQHVYWDNTFSHSIGRANLDGSAANQSFIGGANGPAGVAVDALPLPLYTGSAYGASYQLGPLGGPTFLSNTGEISTTSASDTPKSLVGASAGTSGANFTASLLNADVKTASGTPPGSDATASAASVNITIPGAPVIHADLLSSSSRSTCTGSSGSSQITNLTIGGSSVPVGSAPNTSIPLGLLGSITVNEQTPVSGGLLVNAMHVKVLGTDVVVASARSDIHNC
jgi:hypothetical protein